jgi:hypothetical protein
MNLERFQLSAILANAHKDPKQLELNERRSATVWEATVWEATVSQPPISELGFRALSVGG